MKDMHLDGGIFIPKGVEVVFAHHITHMNAEQWLNPEEFNPDRFNPESELYLTPAGKKRHILAYSPFSSGVRACPGRALAMLELKVLIVFFAKFMEWEISED